MYDDKRFLTYYGLFKFTPEFYHLNSEERTIFLHKFFEVQKQLSTQVWFNLIYPSRQEYDILVWHNQIIENDLDIADLLKRLAHADFGFRKYMDLEKNFWGVTKPSMYSKAKKSAQELDPFEKDMRKTYFTIYPFTKTTEWYLKTREERQEMMNEHIRIGKQYAEITQLLLYSFGIQDQEFIVAYEMENLPLFSDLVYELRGSVARLYTLIDTPIITSVNIEESELISTLSNDWDSNI